MHERGYLLAAPSPAATVEMAEALDRAFAIALDHIGDPEATKVPSINTLRGLVADARLRGPMPYGPGTVFTAVAARGQLVALVSSVCDRFGAGVGVAKGGFVLQSRGRGFSLDPTHPNAAGPGKRPYHTIVPTVVLEKGLPMLSLGVVGGIMQPQGQLQILHHVLTGAELTGALEAPRFRLLGDGTVAVESDFPTDHADAIADAGYQMVSSERIDFGGAQSVMMREGVAHAASDPRRDGEAVVTSTGERRAPTT